MSSCDFEIHMAIPQSPIMAPDMATVNRPQHIVRVIHYVSPIALITYYSAAAIISVCALQHLKVSSKRNSPRNVLLGLVSIVLISYIGEAGMLLSDTWVGDSQYSSTDSNIYALSNALIWVLLFVSLIGTECPVWYPQYGSWFIALLTEVLLIAFRLGQRFPTSAFLHARLTVQACRILTLVGLPTFLFCRSSRGGNALDEESSSLLGQDKSSSLNARASNETSKYGTLDLPHSDAGLEYEARRQKKQEDEQQKLEQRLQDSGSWFSYIAGFSLLLPFMWPSKSRLLQLNILGVGVCILCTRALTLLEPRQLGIVLDHLGSSQGYVPVTELLLFLFYGFLSSSVVSPIRQLLWMPVDISMRASLKKAAYNKIMDLSSDFHTEKQSGELYTSIEQGRSVTSLLETMVLQVGPLILDVFVAFSYLYYAFGPYMALNVAATTVTYLWASSYLIAIQVGPLRRFSGLLRQESQLMYDTIGGWSSVSYFNRQAYEKGRYSGAVDLAMLWERKTEMMYHLACSAQEVVNALGLIVAGVLAVYQIADGTQKLGSFAMLMAYWGAFIGRLGLFAHAGGQIRRALVNAEALLDLFKRKPSIGDGPNHFALKNGTVEFQNVGFSYDDKKETIKNFTFCAKPGQSVALVGETGGGKSTVLKLLFRFYDVQTGKILIDEQDIRDQTLKSLRQCIGVVPQDPALFNDSVIENVRYAKLEASDEEVMEACRGAAIHEKILTFSEGYQTKVGESGVKLSGGELQRIAIARVVLQNPHIVLLDEATSAVDSETEAQIQEALQKLTMGRTTITIAHRLSTITSADVIVVIKDGTILEQGSPHALLKAKGKFSELWLKQIGFNPIPIEETGNEKPTNHRDARKPSSPEVSAKRSEGSASSGKSLRPTAPEFVPKQGFVSRDRRGMDAEEDGSAGNHNAKEHQSIYDGLDVNLRNGVDKYQQKRKTPADLPTDTVLSDSQWDTSDSKHDATGQYGMKKKRLNPAQRRCINKSDPNGSTSRLVQQDDLNEGPTSLISGENSAMHAQSRRVSAPSGPLSAVANGNESGRGQRRRAQRHYRKRQSSDLASMTTSGEGPSAGSSDTLHPPKATVRLPFSGDGTNDAKKSNANGTGSNSVHFAPGS